MLDFIKGLSLWEQSLIIGSFLMFIVIIFGVIVPILKPKIKKTTTIYLYAFSTGYFIVLAIFGLLKDSLNKITESANHSYIVTIVLASGILIGMSTAVLFRYFLSKKSLGLHTEHNHHSHSRHLFNAKDRSKWVAILLLLSHRLVAGLTLGLLVYNFHHTPNDPFNLAITIGFILHLIPEVLIIYYREIEAGAKKWHAIINGLVFKFAMIILILIGAYIADFLSNVYWLIPLFLAISAGAISFAAIFEFTPEILANKTYLKKHWYSIAFTLIFAFIFAIVVLSIAP